MNNRNMKNPKTVLVLVVAILGVMAAVADLGTVYGQEVNFNLVTDTRVWISPVGHSWISNSQFDCAVSCIKMMSSRCYSFWYNLENKRCTPGSWPVICNILRNNSTHHQLFITKASTTNDVYTQTSNENGTICYWLSPRFDKRDFRKANESCREKGLQLLTMTTLQKLYLFRGIVTHNIYSVWIGLDDNVEEDVFRWSDGSILTSDMRKNIFQSVPPNNRGDEDCVEYNSPSFPFNDNNCTQKKRYICEDAHLSKNCKDKLLHS